MFANTIFFSLELESFLFSSITIFWFQFSTIFLQEHISQLISN